MQVNFSVVSSGSEAKMERLYRGRQTIQATFIFTVYSQYILCIQTAEHSQLWMHSENKTSVWTSIKQMNGGKECTQQAGGVWDKEETKQLHIFAQSFMYWTEGTFHCPFVNQ